MKQFKSSQTPKLSVLAFSLALSGSIMLTACEKQHPPTGTKSTQAETESKEVIEATPATEVAQMTLNTASMITYRYRLAKDITAEQKTCLDNIDLKGDVPKLAQLFSESFTEEELEKTVELYNKPEVKQVTQYVLQVSQQVAGIKVDNPAPEPTEVAMKVVQQFGQSEIGQKLNNFTVADELIHNAVSTKIKACNIDPQM